MFARAPLSAVFSLATVCFTAGTSLGALAVDKISPSKAILLIAPGLHFSLVVCPFE